MFVPKIRSLAAFTPLAGLALAAGLAQTAAAQFNPNLTRNPGLLDQDADGTPGDEWGQFGDALVDFDFFGDENPGHGSLFADTPGKFGGVFQLGIPATPGETYEMSIRIQFEPNYDAVTRFGFEFFEADDATKVGETLVEITDEPLGVGYRGFTMTGTAPAGAAIIRPIVQFSDTASSGSSSTATVDNILVNVVDDNVVRNPGFEDVIGDGVNGDFWRTFGNVSLDPDFFNNGNPGHATFFADLPGQGGGIFQLGIPVVPGEDYTLTADISFEANYDAETTLRLEFYGSDENFFLGEEVLEIVETPGIGYLSFRLDATAPSSPFVSFVRPLIVFENAVAPEEGIDLAAATVDNVVLRPTADVPVPCADADVAAPIGELDFTDLLAVLALFDAGAPSVDFAAPFGTLDDADLSAAIADLAAGCP